MTPQYIKWTMLTFKCVALWKISLVLKGLKKAFAQISLHSKNDVVSHCPAEPDVFYLEISVVPNQLVSDEAISSGSKLYFSDCKYILIFGMAQVNRIKIRDE